MDAPPPSAIYRNEVEAFAARRDILRKKLEEERDTLKARLVEVEAMLSEIIGAP